MKFDTKDMFYIGLALAVIGIIGFLASIALDIEFPMPVQILIGSMLLVGIIVSFVTQRLMWWDWLAARRKKGYRMGWKQLVLLPYPVIMLVALLSYDLNLPFRKMFTSTSVAYVFAGYTALLVLALAARWIILRREKKQRFNPLKD